jgi:hypothetical protein
LEPACAEACAALGALGAECVSPTAYIEGMGTFELTLKSNLPVLLGLVELEIPMALEGTQALATALAGLPPADAGNVCADTFAQMVQRVSDAASVLNVALGAPIDVIETTRP